MRGATIKIAKDMFSDRFVMTEVPVSSVSMELSQLLCKYQMTWEDPVPRA